MCVGLLQDACDFAACDLVRVGEDACGKVVLVGRVFGQFGVRDTGEEFVRRAGAKGIEDIAAVFPAFVHQPAEPLHMRGIIGREGAVDRIHVLLPIYIR